MPLAAGMRYSRADFSALTPLVSRPVMHHVRSTPFSYIAAFLLGVLLALLLLVPARAAESSPLDRIAVVRFTAESDGQLRQQSGVLHDDGRFLPRATFLLARPAHTPDWALGRNLVAAHAWQAYHALGYDALARFEAEGGGVKAFIGDTAYMLVAPNLDAPLADGRLSNLSTRARLNGAGEVAIAGFVIEGRARTVLIRAVGPTLQRFGVAAPLADPFLSVKRNAQTIHFNDDWSAAAEGAAIAAAAARVGAFPLEEQSRDAARLLELPPGAYTVEVEPVPGTLPAGEVLIEIYSVPAQLLE